MLRILVNGLRVGSLAFASTGGWSIWKTVSLDHVQLPAGTVTIMAVEWTGGFDLNIDRLTVKRVK